MYFSKSPPPFQKSFFPELCYLIFPPRHPPPQHSRGEEKWKKGTYYLLKTLWGQNYFFLPIFLSFPLPLNPFVFLIFPTHFFFSGGGEWKIYILNQNLYLNIEKIWKKCCITLTQEKHKLRKKMGRARGSR